MKIIATLDDICRPEDWLVTNHAHMVVKTYPPQLAGVQIKGKDLLALAANQQQMPEVLTIWDADHLSLPHTVHFGYALMDDSAEEAWLCLADKIRKAIKEAEFEPCRIPKGMNAYYLLEFDLCES